MRICCTVACLSALLLGSLLSCQHPDQGQDPAPTPTQTEKRTDPYLFTGNPGIRTSGIDDISGTLTGTIDGKPIAFGPDKPFAVKAYAGYNSYTPKASVLNIQAYSDQYSISVIFNGPFESGRNYRVYNADDDDGEGKLDPYIATPFIRVPEGQTGRSIIDLKTPDEQVRITAITADYIDIELLFALSKPGAVQERISIRIRNIIDENRALRTQSEGDPFWSYTDVDRRIEAWGYGPRQGAALGSPTTTRVRISQNQLTTPVSDISYDGKTEPFTSQSSSLYRIKQPTEQTYVECLFGMPWSAAGWKSVEIVWPDFRGAGTYTGDQVQLTFINSLGGTNYWRVKPSTLASASTKWQVDVKRVTADVIEGTYTIVEAPLVDKNGSVPMPVLVSVSGRFKVIYPR
ncbi:hypothetical protein [Spirosoma validum]|nr:hypothetical protein [Spirosoma validum]